MPVHLELHLHPDTMSACQDTLSLSYRDYLLEKNLKPATPSQPAPTPAKQDVKRNDEPQTPKKGWFRVYLWPKRPTFSRNCI